MSSSKKIKKALISVFYKDGLAPIAKILHENNVEIFSTGGTQNFLEELNIPVHPVENLTNYPSILGGRVKTLHPKIFGGILHRADHHQDQEQLKEFEIPAFDLVIVDLYPFEETLASGAEEQAIIEKIDIGGISLIRAAAKNFKEVLIASNRKQYGKLEQLLAEKNCESELSDRKTFAAEAFAISSNYDTAICNYFYTDREESPLKISVHNQQGLRYGENPHQKGEFAGDLNAMFDQLHGKELSYNNLLDVDAAVSLMQDYQNEGPTYAILKHNNACGLATRKSLLEAYEAALAADPVSAFGGILISNCKLDYETAEKINSLFCEVVIAPDFEENALELLKGKKNRILLKQHAVELSKRQVRTALNGFLVQDKDLITETVDSFSDASQTIASPKQREDLVFASKLVKHTKSNAIVLAKDKQLLASGTGQTSRVDALNQAIAKANHFGFDLNDAVMASDAFFPFPDCVEIAHKAGIKAVVQPGGSIKDQLSIDYCNENGLAMVFTGVRHFKH